MAGFGGLNFLCNGGRVPREIFSFKCQSLAGVCFSRGDGCSFRFFAVESFRVLNRGGEFNVKNTGVYLANFGPGLNYIYYGRGLLPRLYQCQPALGRPGFPCGMHGSRDSLHQALIKDKKRGPCKTCLITAERVPGQSMD